MKKLLWFSTLFASMIFIFQPNSSLAQWPTDPSANLLICDHSGEQTIPKVAAISDGGCYISWWDNSSGHYCMYLQRVNALGEIQWQSNGLLISDHSQDSWLTDYDLGVDNSDYAIIALNDTRAGGDWDIYGYRISPAGEFAWGADGIAISDNTGFEPDPRVITTSNGNIVFGWQEENLVHLRKITPAGTDVWNPATKTLTTQYGYSIVRLAPALNDEFILQMLKATGSGYAPKHLYAFKFDSLGVALWGDAGVVVTSAGGFGFQMRPDIIPDGAGGVYSYWYDSRNQVLHSFAQHILANGTMRWTANGVQLSTSGAEIQGQPAIARVNGTGEIILGYETANVAQTLNGLGAQMLDSTGARQWSNTGRILVPLGNSVSMMVNACEAESGAVISCLQTPPGNFANSLVKAIRLDRNGNPVWDPQFTTMSSVVSSKGYYNAAKNPIGQVFGTWADNRNSSSPDIYAVVDRTPRL